MATYSTVDPSASGQPVGQILDEEVGPDTEGPFNEIVVNWLAVTLADTTVDQLCALGVRGLNAVLRRSDVPADTNVLGIARIVFDRLRDLEIIANSQPAAAAPTAPITVHVERDTPLDQMKLGDLLTLLIENPGDYSELAPVILAHKRVAAVMRKTPKWIVPTAGGSGVDREATLTYVSELEKEWSTAQTKLPDGRRPITLERAFGRNERPIIHPFIYVPVSGVVDGVNWDGVDPELICALLWAGLSTPPHPNWPTSIDVYTHSREIVHSPLPERWQGILDDYRAACEEDPGARIASPYATDEMLALVRRIRSGDAAPFAVAGEPAHDDTWYHAQLQSIAESPISESGGSVRRSHCVVSSIDCSGGSITLNRVIALGNIDCSGGSIKGAEVYLAPGVSARCSGGSRRATIYNRTNQQLYELAVSWGLLGSGTTPPSSDHTQFNIAGLSGARGVQLGNRNEQTNNW